MEPVSQSFRKPSVLVLGQRLWLALLGTLCLIPGTNAAEIQKTDDATDLNNRLSWVGGIAPGTAEVAVFDNTITSGAISPNIGAPAIWQGGKAANPCDLIAFESLMTARCRFTLSPVSFAS